MNDEGPLLDLRAEFPILRETAYLVSHSLGAMPESTREAMAEFAELWSRRGVRAWEDAWWTMSAEVGDMVAPFVGAEPGSIVMLPNVTTAEAVVISALDFAPPRSRVVMAEGEFPSVRYVWSGLARRLGAEIELVPPDASGIRLDLDRLLEAIDERTVAVPISHVLFESSFMVDAEAVARRCRAVGATLILDVFQSAGIAPVHLRRWGAPIAVGGVLKWLCGGPGGAFLYVAPELRPRLEPALTGWMAHHDPFSFEPPPMRHRDDALRFALGTPAVPSLYAAREGLRATGRAFRLGIDAIRRKSLRQTRLIFDAAGARGFRLLTPAADESRGGTVSILPPHAREVAAELNARHVVCDFRPRSGIRLSPHFYTSDGEIERAFAEIDDILATGVWQKHRERRMAVT
ncbi:MAG TPA: aminotransferase class V-fold PLP-dependent enzyme [Thermoanaerobaculia bacterium]|nr:aminotransferase class V-fold PLP-dependent enzyme [Thermoanaerobaculia bacterium]